MEIRKYEKADEDNVMRIIELEGEDWKDYSAPEAQEKYRKALGNSITYVAVENGEICGYSRSINDNDYYIYVFDLLVTPKHRGKNLGRQLMECIYKDYPSIMDVFVTSDVDEYYKKQGYVKEGTVFKVTNKNN